MFRTFPPSLRIFSPLWDYKKPQGFLGLCYACGILMPVLRSYQVSGILVNLQIHVLVMIQSVSKNESEKPIILFSWVLHSEIDMCLLFLPWDIFVEIFWECQTIVNLPLINIKNQNERSIFQDKTFDMCLYETNWC